MDPESVVLVGLARAVGIVFAYATVAKVIELSAVTEALKNYGLVPAPLVSPAVFLLILSEATVAISHLGLIALPLASPLAASLLVIFLGFSIRSVLRDDSRRCLCFGANRTDKVNGLTIARISALLVAEAIVLIAVMRADRVSPTAVDTATTATSLTVALTLIALASWGLTIPTLFTWWRLRPQTRLLSESGLPIWETDPLHLRAESEER